MALIGALFALSFDTLSLTVLFAIAASSMAGMVVTDGLSGWWMEKLLRRAGERAAAASRAMVCVIGALSIGVGALGALKYLHPHATAFYEGRELYFGAALVATTPIAFFVVAGFARCDRQLRWISTQLTEMRYIRSTKEGTS